LSWCQSKNHAAKFDYPGGKGFVWILRKNIKLSREDYAHTCIQGTTYIKFQIGSNGKVKNISFPTILPDSLKKAIEEGFQETERFWMPKVENGVNVDSDTIILKVTLFIERGCDYKIESDSAIVINALKPNDEYKDKGAIVLEPSLYIHVPRDHYSITN
jgi:hypothetical protein